MCSSDLDDVFSGEDNFFATYSPEGDPEALVRELGERHEILRGGIKRWCVGGPAQAPLDVLYTLMQAHGLKADDVASVVVRLPATELQIVNNRDMPNISLQHLLGLMLVDGNLSFTSSRDTRRMRDARIVRLRDRIRAVADPSIPNNVRGWRCGMDITLKDGRSLSSVPMWGIDPIANRSDATSKLVIWDYGTPPPPVGPFPPVDGEYGKDPHGAGSDEPLVLVQALTFLLDGNLLDVCGGPCIGAQIDQQ